jgi:hypothetical protein
MFIPDEEINALNEVSRIIARMDTHMYTLRSQATVLAHGGSLPGAIDHLDTIGHSLHSLTEAITNRHAAILGTPGTIDHLRLKIGIAMESQAVTRHLDKADRKAMLTDIDAYEGPEDIDAYTAHVIDVVNEVKADNGWCDSAYAVLHDLTGIVATWEVTSWEARWEGDTSNPRWDGPEYAARSLSNPDSQKVFTCTCRNNFGVDACQESRAAQFIREAVESMTDGQDTIDVDLSTIVPGVAPLTLIRTVTVERYEP